MSQFLKIYYLGRYLRSSDGFDRVASLRATGCATCEYFVSPFPVDPRGVTCGDRVESDRCYRRDACLMEVVAFFLKSGLLQRQVLSRYQHVISYYIYLSLPHIASSVCVLAITSFQWLRSMLLATRRDHSLDDPMQKREK
jgi:hypothetical protein